MGGGNKVMEKHTGCVGNYLKSRARNVVSRLRDLFLKELQSCMQSFTQSEIRYLPEPCGAAYNHDLERPFFAFLVIVISSTLR